MSVLVASSSVRTCFGNGPSTFDALLGGRSGVEALRYDEVARLGVAHGYHLSGVGAPAHEAITPVALADLLGTCVAEAVADAEIVPSRDRVVALVGTGLRQLRAVELDDDIAAEHLHFAAAVEAAAPDLMSTTTIANACSASGHAIALAQDLLELGEADAVVVVGVDTMTESMLALIGRFAEQVTTQVRPFDVSRSGVLLGEGIGAQVVVPDRPGRSTPPLARILATGLTCDAFHETAPHPEGVRRAMIDAFDRAGREPDAVDVVFAHGTGTRLNDPVEASVIRDLFGTDGRPLVTAVKGAVGHTSGNSALLGIDLAISCLRSGLVPPVVGLAIPTPEAAGLALVESGPTVCSPRLVQVNAFGFGGVNAVTLVEAVS